MTPRENYVSIARRTGYEYMPVSLNMSPSIRKKYEAYTASHDLELPVGEGTLSDLPADCLSPEEFRKRLENFIRKTAENKLIIGYGGIAKYYGAAEESGGNDE